MTALHDLFVAVQVAPVVPVLVVPEASAAAPLANALADGGLKVAEVTLRTPDALEVIKRMKTARPDLVVGAGTVLTGEDAHLSVEMGADFLVSPGMTPTLLQELGGLKEIMIPGVATASEAMCRKDEGFGLLKLFPAAIAGGVNALKALAGPLPHIQFMPTGGVNAENAGDYLALPNVAAIGGSWIATKNDIEEAAWDKIRDKAAASLRAG